MPDKQSSVQNILEVEFCPPLDTALVAAMLADYALETAEQRAVALKELKEKLSILTTNTTADFDESTNTPNSSRTSIDESDILSDTDDELSSRTSISEGNGFKSPDSALDFLRASFPHLNAEKLKVKLRTAETQSITAMEVDMERLIEEILSEEFVREMEERGVQDEEELAEQMNEWQVVQRKLPNQARKKRKGKTIALSDVRQQQQQSATRPKKAVPNPHPAGDPWNQLASIATYLEMLLTPHRSIFFLSYFHKPEYGGPADALRAALATITQDQPWNSAEGAAEESNKLDCNSEEANHENKLFNLIEVLCLEQRTNYENFNEACEQLRQDADLALRATQDQPDIALEVVKLLHDLDADGYGPREMGVYHSPAAPLLATLSTGSSTVLKRDRDVITPSTNAWKSTAGVHPSQPPASSVPKPKPPPAPNQSPKENGWQQVKIRHKQTTNPLAAHIPAYNPHNVPRRKTRGNGNANGKGGKGDVGELKPIVRAPAPLFRSEPRLINGAISRTHGRSINEVHTRRNEALREASRHWAKGSAHNRGGEVAWHYALEAQKFQEEARRLKLDAARQLVEGKRNATVNRDTIDLHYCTTSEALTIVHEILDEGWVCSFHPLQIITGRGSHSTRKVGVLGPVVCNALEREGWRVRQWDGGLIVRGRA